MRQSVVLLYILSYAEYIGKNFKCQNKKQNKGASQATISQKVAFKITASFIPP